MAVSMTASTQFVDAEASSPARIADRAGLRYRPDDRPGIARRRRGRGFSYAGPRRGTVSPEDRRRIQRLVIPPAWKHVWIAPEADAHLQATGFDDAGRKQYLYHEAWRQAADEAKFERLAEFGPALERLRRRVATDLAERNGHLLAATVTRLIDRCLIRPGTRRTSPRGEAVGATSLGCTDVTIRGGLIVLDFVGKSGVDQHVEVRDRELARILSDLLDDAVGGDLFASATGDTIDERRLNDYLAEATGTSFTAKDFRTWGATATVVGELAPSPVPSDDNDVATAERSAIALAADALGNSVAVCRSSYVAPAVLDAFESGVLARIWRASRRGRWLSRAERTTARALG